MLRWHPDVCSAYTVVALTLRKMYYRKTELQTCKAMMMVIAVICEGITKRNRTHYTFYIRLSYAWFVEE